MSEQTADYEADQYRQKLDTLLTELLPQTDHRGNPTPGLIGDLETTIAKQTAMGADPGVRVQSNNDDAIIFNETASNRMATLRQELERLRIIVDKNLGRTFTFEPSPARLAESIRNHTRWLSRQPEIGTHVIALTSACTKARHACDRPPAKNYVGPCGYDDGTTVCEWELYVEPSDKSVVCPVCGKYWDVDERRKNAFDSIPDDLTAPISTITRVFRNEDIEITRSQLQHWADRKLIDSALVDENGRKQYRLLDVYRMFQLMEAKMKNAARKRKTA